MAVTTLATAAQVTSRLDIGAAVDAALVGQVLKGVTQRIANFCNRRSGTTNLLLRQSAFTEYLAGDGGNVIRLSLYPVETITSLTYGGASLDWTNGTAYTQNTDYTLKTDSGLLTMTWGTWPMYDQCLKCVYTGGYVDPDSTPTTGQTALPDDIVEACIQQCVYDYKTRQNIGTPSVNAAGGASYIKHDGLMPQVKEMLAPYKRMFP